MNEDLKSAWEKWRNLSYPLNYDEVKDLIYDILNSVANIEEGKNV